MSTLTLDQLVTTAQTLPPCRIVVVAAHDLEVLKSVEEAQQYGIATAVLLGDARQIEAFIWKYALKLGGVQIRHQPDDALAAVQAMALVKEGSANVVVKGQIKTASLLRAALDRQSGIRAKKLLSHVGLLEIPGLDRLLLLSDGGVILYPTTLQKLAIIRNAISVAHSLGCPQPKVAILSANEQVHPSRPTGAEALLLSRMASEGWITGALVDGPMPLDVALDPQTARLHHMDGPVAGQADIVIVPNVEAGNIAVKAIQYVGHGDVAGLVIGAQVPIIINSRADDAVTRLRSIAMAAVVAAGVGHDAALAKEQV